MSTQEAQTSTKYKRALDATHSMVSKGSRLVYSPISRSMKILNWKEWKHFSICESFDTIEGHAQKIVTKLELPLEATGAVTQFVSHLADQGLLISHESLVAQLADESDPGVTPPITALTIPTKNRPEELASGLKSWAECIREHQRDVDVIVSDQSDTESNRQANIELLNSIKSAYGLKLFYGGTAHHQEMARYLAEKVGCDPSILRFALLNDESCSAAYGASRNALILGTAGSLILQSDDDVECRLAPKGEGLNTLTLCSDYSRHRIYYPSEDEAAKLDETFTPADILARHEKLLGQTVAQCMRQFESIDLDQASIGFFRRFGPRRVWSTQTGVGGTRTSGTFFYDLFLDREGSNTLLRSEQNYGFAMSNGCLMLRAPQPIISSGTYFSSMCFGLDNRQLLPPFMPVQRSADTAFATLIDAGGSGYFGHLPFMMLHKKLLPEQSDDLRNFASTIRLGRIMNTLLKKFTPDCIMKNSHPANNLEAVGRSLVDFASVSESEFFERLRVIMGQGTAGIMEHLEQRLEERGHEPKYWANDVQICLQAMKDAVVKPNYVVPIDLSDAFGEEAAKTLTQRLVRRFGELLIAWREIREAAQTSVQNGWQPFQKI